MRITFLIVRGCLLSLVAGAPGFASGTISSEFLAKLGDTESERLLLKDLSGTEVHVGSTEEGLSLTAKVGSKRLAWICRTRDGHVLIFDLRERSWPGNQPITLVLTNHDFELEDWMVTGGQPIFERAEIREGDNSATLEVLFRRRSRGALVERFALENSRIARVSSVEEPDLKLGTLLHE